MIQIFLERCSVVFEDHYLSSKISVVDYQFNVMVKWAFFFDLAE